MLILVTKEDLDPSDGLVSGFVMPLHTEAQSDSGFETLVAQPVNELASQMRDLVDLPVQDLARMCGLRRRQYYNVMSGEAASTRSEQLMRLLHAELTALWQELDSDPALVRSAVLTRSKRSTTQRSMTSRSRVTPANSGRRSGSSLPA